MAGRHLGRAGAGGQREALLGPDDGGGQHQHHTRQGDQQNLFSYSLDELAKEPPAAQQLTGGRRTKRDYAFSADSKQVYYLDGGRGNDVYFADSTDKIFEVNNAGRDIVHFTLYNGSNQFTLDLKFSNADSISSVRTRHCATSITSCESFLK